MGASSPRSLDRIMRRQRELPILPNLATSITFTEDIYGMKVGSHSSSSSQMRHVLANLKGVYRIPDAHLQAGL